MGLLSWLAERMKPEAIPLDGGGWKDQAVEYAGDIYIQEIAFWTAVNLYAGALAKCEFRTFQNGAEKKGREYYLWNFEPNQNQNSAAFIHKWLAALFRENKCLIIEHNERLYVADSYQRTANTLYDDLFTQVQVGEITFGRTFSQRDVLFFQLSAEDMRKLTNGLYATYAKLINNAVTAYNKSKKVKGIFSYETQPVAGPEKTAFDELINERIKKWISTDANMALPLGKGQKWSEPETKTYKSDDTRDIRAQIDDVCDFTAKCFSIPPALLRGTVENTENALDQFLTFGLDPLLALLAKEINRKRYGFSGVSTSSYLTIDATHVRHVDILKVSTPIERLISSGAFSVNDIRKLCGQTRIDEPWADRHWMTKNYEAILESLVRVTEGGEKE